MDENKMLGAALGYAKLGLRVHPLLPGDKRPALKGWPQMATQSEEQIRTWWVENPAYNIGIATGNGLVVIDLDHKKGVDGYQALAEYEAQRGPLPPTWKAVTPSGGAHFYYQTSGTEHNRAGLYPGVDVRGEGGYVVAPPSILPGGVYRWEAAPYVIPIAAADHQVHTFLAPVPENFDRGGMSIPFTMTETIEEGQRVNTLVRLVGSLQAKGLGDDAIRAAVHAENEARCNPPLTGEELEREVFPALGRWAKGTSSYTAQGQQEQARVKSYSLDMVSLADVEEKEPEWLIPNYIPKREITVMGGDGGVGKTFVWCGIAAAISSGYPSFLENNTFAASPVRQPQTVMFFSAEDSYEYVLRKRLRKSGADLTRFVTFDCADERFQAVKLNSAFLERLLERHRPALCIFDPLQAFLPPGVNMSARNDMRSCMSKLHALGERYGTTFLIVMHTNKMSSVWGRQRLADSSDIWDIARSVLIAGKANDKGLRYLSHEKSNYGEQGRTVLFRVVFDAVDFHGYAEKRDRDFVLEASKASKETPAKDEASAFILDYLQEIGECRVSELDEAGVSFGISKRSLRDAKEALKKAGRLQYRRESAGDKKGVVWHISLIPPS